jgi:predicted O-methyltransferase YrrM
MKYEDPEIPGWMWKAELQWLYQTAKGMKTIVEVGSWMGKSTHALCSGCPGTVFAVDTFMGTDNERDTYHAYAKTHSVREAFNRNVGHFDNLVVLAQPSTKAVAWFDDRSIDMVFIDGDHSYEAALADFVFWSRKCKVLFCGHDKDHTGVPRALRDFGRPWLIGADSIWYMDVRAI